MIIIILLASFFFSCLIFYAGQKSNHCLIELLKLCEMCVLYRLILHMMWVWIVLGGFRVEAFLFFVCYSLPVISVSSCRVFFCFFFVSSLCVSLWTTRTLVTHISITDRVQYISRPKSGSHLLTNYRRSSSFRLSLFFFFHLFLAFLFFMQLSLLFFRVSILILLDKNRNGRQAQSPTRT